MNANPFFRPAFGFSLALALVAGTPPPARAETIFSQDFESDLGSNESTFGNFSINNTLAALNNGTFMMGHAVPYGGLDSAATPLPSYSYYELVLDLRGVVDSELRFDFAGGIEKDFDGFNLVATTGRRNLPPGGLITPTVGSTFQYDSDPLIQHGESSPSSGRSPGPRPPIPRWWPPPPQSSISPPLTTRR